MFNSEEEWSTAIESVYLILQVEQAQGNLTLCGTTTRELHSMRYDLAARVVTAVVRTSHAEGDVSDLPEVTVESVTNLSGSGDDPPVSQ